MAQSRVRVGIVGAGYVAPRHLAALKDLPFVKVVGICDVNPSRATALAARFGSPPVFASLEAMAEARPQVIHILTPPSSHCSLTLQALDMNCNVFVEKPMAETVQECDRMIAKAAEKSLVLSINHSLLFEPSVRKARELIATGRCGGPFALHYFRGSDYPPYPGGPPTAAYRQGSYPFRDLGVHAVYLFEAFLGPIHALNVRYYASGRDPMIAFDEWRVEAECEHGTGYSMLSWNMRPLQNEFWVHGTRGIVHVNVFLQQCRLHCAYPGPKHLHFILNGMRHSFASLFQIPAFLIRGVTGALKPSPGIYESVMAFHNALKDGRPAPVSAEDGRRTVAWVVQASRAADEEKDRTEFERERSRPAPARVLVTGASGLVGSALIRRLRDKGERPRVFLRRPAAPGSAAEGLDAVYGSLGEPDAVDRSVAGVEVVYHVGAAMKGGAGDFEAGTIWGTRNVIASCLRHGVKRLVYVSSVGVLDHAHHRDGEPVTEESPLEPRAEQRGIYTQSKLAAERMLLDAVREHGLPAVILRPGQIFGPGAEQRTPNGIIRLAGQWIVAGRGTRLLPLVYVEDVVDGLIAAETAPNAIGQVINLIDPTPVTQNQYLAWCGPALGETPVRRVPVPFLLMAGWMCEILSRIVKRPLPLSRYRVQSLKPLSRPDISRARNLLGWAPGIGVARGLELTFKPFRQQ